MISHFPEAGESAPAPAPAPTPGPSKSFHATPASVARLYVAYLTAAEAGAEEFHVAQDDGSLAHLNTRFAYYLLQHISNLTGFLFDKGLPEP